MSYPRRNQFSRPALGRGKNLGMVGKTTQYQNPLVQKAGKLAGFSQTGLC